MRISVRFRNIPPLLANQNNRFAFILNAYHADAPNDDITWDTLVTVKYWPRFLYIRP